MNIPSKFDSEASEDKWYSYWIHNDYFHSEPDHRTPYTIVIPPPNVTGILHMGHMLNNTIQDVLIRRARMKGLNACWVPGTDHASIATEAKVVQRLKEQGIEKSDLTREAFLEHAWSWTHEHGGIILEQLKKLGCSCDWKRTKFTMDPDLSESVISVFISLYEKGKIYRGHRMVNWDPEAQTTLSDEEVIYEERQGNLYYLQYTVVDSDEKITIATTRPETILGDTAVAVHPEDERFNHLHGKKVIVPIVGREIPIITDPYVDIEFGTGCLKITPAHDENDKAIGEKHGLEIIDIFNANATLNSFGLHYEGKDRFVVRKEITKELSEKGYLVKKEPHLHKVGTSERTKAVIEPRLSDQWFLKMKELAQPALEAVLDSDEIQLFPKKFNNTYRHWMENIRDWNISRQLWWGHQIPAYYYGDGNNDFVVAASAEEALKKAIEKTKNASLQLSDLRQDPDTLDTWFSSWLWPISVFDGIRFPDNEEINYYYPTNDLVTGPDIIFFWVARMIISGYEFRDEKPFSNVYLTGLVRDKQGRKMSKQLGNSPDALGLIKEFGADGVRVGLLLSAAAGNDLLFDESLCQQGKNFSNKIWNATRLIQGWEVSEDAQQPLYSKQGLEWYEAKFQSTLVEIEDHFSKYRISDALMAIYKLVWDDFCSWLLEIVKPPYGSPIDRISYQKAVYYLEQNLKLIHPFMPFLTEEIWQFLEQRTPDKALIVSQWPEMKNFDKTLLKNFETSVSLVANIRSIRKEKNVSFKEALSLVCLGNSYAIPNLEIVQKLGNIDTVTFVNEKPSKAVSFRVDAFEFFIPMTEGDVTEELEKIQEELKYAKGFLTSVQKKLSNERFVSGAPEKVVAVEKQKEADALAKIATLEASLESLKS